MSMKMAPKVMVFLVLVSAVALWPSANCQGLVLSSAAREMGLTYEDVSVYMRIVRQDETIYQNLLVSNAADFQALLSSRTIAAFNVSQAAGKCAWTLSQTALTDLNEKAEAATVKLSETSRTLWKTLQEAETQDERVAAVEKVITTKMMTAASITQVSTEMAQTYTTAVVAIKDCIKQK
ncbi:Hypothetical protein NTJ_03569 [Nesidiocoris tenuis]|uniref:Uncharacterized protein n=1 Tax=Nesidiocoris tenuis TaxID=355587 RepID=A0ABN7AEQ5_9HEMI|nr:Hypothetical protein NTJ_03569 [Nesidiocoris tenuis]